MYIVKVFFLLYGLVLTRGQAAGWKMTDRFTGFRFELFAEPLDLSLEESIQSYADSQSCFGWVQRTSNSLVGEVRCSKLRGQEFLLWLKHVQHVTNVESLVIPRLIYLLFMC